jgi:hypothetical protein
MTQTPFIREVADKFAALEASANFYDLSGFNLGTTTTSTLLAVHIASRALTMPSQNHAGAYAGTAGGDPTSLNIKHGGGASALSTASVVGTIAFASAATSGSVNIPSAVAVNIGDVVAVQASVAGASNIADFGWSIQANSD